MSVLTAIQRACTVIGVDVPTLVFGSTEREHIELQMVANEIAKRICDSFDWSSLKAVASLTGDGVASSFALPSDYLRMIKKAKLWPASPQAIPLRHVSDSDNWLGNELNGFTGLNGEWTLYDGKIHIRPNLANATTVRFFYIKNNVTAGGGEFTSDADIFLLSERVLTLGIIWQWKANKGQPYAEDLENYETALAMQIGNDKGSNIITLGSGRIRGGGGGDVAFPYSVGL